jgi:F5/8 type C domain.
MKKLMLVAATVLALVTVFLTIISAETKAAANLALDKPVTESSHTQYFFSKNINDGNIATYWEGEAKSYPNLITIDLETPCRISSVVIKLNPNPVWEARSQTMEILGSLDGNQFTTLVASAKYDFDPDTNQNTVTIPVTATARYLRLSFTANTEATGGQIAELEAY